jgi:NADH:ubiquinone oxidoreductase subunit 3 (subunit A)
MEVLLYPPIAFVIYLVLVGVLSGVGRALAIPAHNHADATKSSAYASGEVGETYQAAPGYRQFFVVALFFAVLHLGMLLAGSSGLTLVTAAYIVGLILALVALILG